MKESFLPLSQWIRHANKGLGQHFLHDANVLRKMTDLMDLRNKEVMEIGGGIGSLTYFILQQNTKSFKVVELDSYYATFLRDRLEVEVIENDCMKESYDVEVLVGNLPYNVSVPFIIKLVLEDNWSELYFLVQKEVAQRICASPNCKQYGSLSAIVQIVADCQVLMELSPHVFIPKPKVDSSLVKIKRIKEIDRHILRKFYNQLLQWFKHRRKKFLHTNLRIENINPQELFSHFSTSRNDQVNKTSS